VNPQAVISQLSRRKNKGERPRRVSIKPKKDHVAARADLHQCCHSIW